MFAGEDPSSSGVEEAPSRRSTLCSCRDPTLRSCGPGRRMLKKPKKNLCEMFLVRYVSSSCLCPGDVCCGIAQEAELSPIFTNTSPLLLLLNLKILDQTNCSINIQVNPSWEADNVPLAVLKGGYYRFNAFEVCFPVDDQKTALLIDHVKALGQIAAREYSLEVKATRYQTSNMVQNLIDTMFDSSPDSKLLSIYVGMDCLDLANYNINIFSLTTSVHVLSCNSVIIWGTFNSSLDDILDYLHYYPLNEAGTPRKLSWMYGPHGDGFVQQLISAIFRYY
uniref:Uncharacterized protein n=1 Tax=Ditylenchus dipsaci TaxID=166011 RepID=A0A915E6D2_9BILA